jgi:rare lipoprotein A
MKPRALLAALALAACTPPAAPPPAAVHYVVEPAWQAAGGAWFYPREQFDYDATGIATVLSGPHPPLTTDGEAYDPTALAGAHPTLQLPCVVRVTNLANGRQVLVRVNDRGPDSPARLIALTPRAALLLALPPEGAAPVRVETDGTLSRALADSLRDATAGNHASAAPRGAVARTDLPPPPGVRIASRGRLVPGAAAAAADPAAAAAPEVPLRLPEAVRLVPYYPGQIYLRASVFGQATYADRQLALLAGQPREVLRTRAGRSETFQVRAGPFASVAAADAALDQALRQGVTDAHLVVE